MCCLYLGNARPITEQGEEETQDINKENSLFKKFFLIMEVFFSLAFKNGINCLRLNQSVHENKRANYGEYNLCTTDNKLSSNLFSLLISVSLIGGACCVLEKYCYSAILYNDHRIN